MNNFEKGGASFGWKAIEDMLSREIQRKKQNELPRVPGLKENFVYRDPWTRLNVKPATIMHAGMSRGIFYIILYQTYLLSSSWFI